MIKRVSFAGARCTGATHFAASEWCGCAAAGTAVLLRSESDLQSVWRVERVLRRPLLLIRTRAAGVNADDPHSCLICCWSLLTIYAAKISWKVIRFRNKLAKMATPVPIPNSYPQCLRRHRSYPAIFHCVSKQA